VLQVDAVVDVMRNNLTMVLERDQKLSDLNAAADRLENSSVNFSKSSTRLRKKFWWENLKMKLIIGGIVIALVVIIVTVIAVETSGGSSHPETTQQTPQQSPTQN
jgi:hypothetical protein